MKIEMLARRLTDTDTDCSSLIKSSSVLIMLPYEESDTCCLKPKDKIKMYFLFHEKEGRMCL